MLAASPMFAHTRSGRRLALAAPGTRLVVERELQKAMAVDVMARMGSAGCIDEKNEAV